MMTEESPDVVSPSRRSNILLTVKLALADQIAEKGFAYVGPNAERSYNLNRVRFNSIVRFLREDGYNPHYLELEKPDTEVSEMILVKVLAPAGTTQQKVWANRDLILKMWADAQPQTRN